MRVAVLSLTRDRLDYTKHCFATLRANAGCEFDHYVLDQGSEDGTADWLRAEFSVERIRVAQLEPTNIGISRGLNALLDISRACGEYDVIVKVDNDCEIVTQRTLRDVAAAALSLDALLSPRIHGLRFPPATLSQASDGQVTIDVTSRIGGIFIAFPARFFNGWRCPTNVPVYDGDDDLMARASKLGMLTGYIQGYDAFHYETTDGQHARYPEYFERKRSEGLAL
jgi:GT2 family glycosyltransferase